MDPAREQWPAGRRILVVVSMLVVIVLVLPTMLLDFARIVGSSRQETR